MQDFYDWRSDEEVPKWRSVVFLAIAFPLPACLKRYLLMLWSSTLTLERLIIFKVQMLIILSFS